jgi:tetratricopeptide (TPR) repeat protein
MSFPDVSTIIPALRKNWYHPIGLAASCIVGVAIEVPLLAVAKPSSLSSFLIVLVTLCIILALWLYSRKLPKTAKKRVGFAVSLWCDDEIAARRVREDFVLTLRRLIKSGMTAGSFQFLEIPTHISQTVIDQDDAHALRIKTKSHFLIYGRVRLRKLEEHEHYFLELDGIVAHRPIPTEVSSKLSNEFSELLPRKVAIARENDLFAFQFTSEWADIVARYIIGIAAALSGDLAYSEGLYIDALNRVNRSSADFPVFSKLAERIPIRLFELKQARAKNAHELWVRDHHPSHISTLGQILEEIEATHPGETYKVLTLRAIHVFLSRRDVHEATRLLNSLRKNDRDAAWHLNQGFLRAYAGDLRSAIRHYRNALAFEINADLIYKIEDFLCFIVAEEENKYQLYYCLGFFNWQIKGDHKQALLDFGRFLEHNNGTDFATERTLAEKWITEIKRTLARQR